jgi:hypothetical protein
MTLLEALPTLLLLALGLGLIYLLHHRLSGLISSAVQLAGGNIGVVALALFVIFLPGIIVHELSHLVMAKVLGLRAGRFRVWPEVQRDGIGLGSVSVEQADSVRGSLVGAAPLITGTVLLTLLGLYVLRAGEVMAVLAYGDWSALISAFWGALQGPDGLVATYIMFAIGNMMMPSRSDRQAWRGPLLFLGMVSILYVIVGLPAEPFMAVLDWVTPLFQVLNLALFFVVLVDAVLFVPLWLLVAWLRQRPPYKK